MTQMNSSAPHVARKSQGARCSGVIERVPPTQLLTPFPDTARSILSEAPRRAATSTFPPSLTLHLSLLSTRFILDLQIFLESLTRTMVRQLKYHEQKLLKKVDFLNVSIRIQENPFFASTTY